MSVHLLVGGSWLLKIITFNFTLSPPLLDLFGTWYESSVHFYLLSLSHFHLFIYPNCHVNLLSPFGLSDVLTSPYIFSLLQHNPSIFTLYSSPVFFLFLSIVSLVLIIAIAIAPRGKSPLLLLTSS